MKRVGISRSYRQLVQRVYQRQAISLSLIKQIQSYTLTLKNIVPLVDRPVLGLGEFTGVRRAPTVSRVTVDGISCSESMINAGSFGMDYDAQVANIELVTEGVFGSAGVFNTNSRAAIHGMGPHSGRLPISYALWFKTTTYGPRILLAYKTYWNRRWTMVRIQEWNYKSIARTLVAHINCLFFWSFVSDLKASGWATRTCLQSRPKGHYD